MESAPTCQRITGKDLPTGEDTRCGAPLDRKGSPQWCKACWATYHKDYQPKHQENREEMARGEGFAKGVSGLRGHLANRFARLGSDRLTGYDAAEWILKERFPQ